MNKQKLISEIKLFEETIPRIKAMYDKELEHNQMIKDKVYIKPYDSDGSDHILYHLKERLNEYQNHLDELKEKLNLIDTFYDKVIKLDKVTRFEVIDLNGRAYDIVDENLELSLSLQDDGTTLKIFTNLPLNN